MIRFIYPIQVYYIENAAKPITPYVALGIFGGFVVTGFLVKTMIVKLVRKHV